MLTIAWDVDDVLNDFTRVWFETVWRPRHPECRLSYEDLRSNPPHEQLGITRDEYLSSLDEFRHSRYLTDLQPLPEALSWFEKNGARHRHIALTAAPLRCAPVSAAWTLRHFGRWIRGFHVVPSSRQDESIPEYDQSKRDFISRSEDISLLVEDHPANINAAADLGIQVVLMPRPWNSAARSISAVFRDLENL